MKLCFSLLVFTCHDQGASSLVYAPQHQLLISAGKKGDVCIFDVRQRQMRHRFQAHDSAVKCLAIDPGEEFFVTGSADGDIKVCFYYTSIQFVNILIKCDISVVSVVIKINGVYCISNIINHLSILF